MNQTTDQWNQTRALFRLALSQPTTQQTQFIRDADASEAVKNEAMALLNAAEKSGQSFEAVIATAAASIDSPRDLEVDIDHYRLLRLLGEGGMGQVYLAARTDGRFEQQVALKLLSVRRPSDELVARFVAERQILASLEHPNIARLLDGGETEDGAPYLVMEFIDGLAIDHYCEQTQLERRERIRLFLDVCRAVDHAHRNLIIHRDVKPSNVLVTRDGQIKLLDFGIAKLLESDPGQHLTQPADRILSPLNASPEQVRGDAITVATDVYSLGVLLYQLLTGAHPYADSVDTPQDIQHAICEIDPSRPGLGGDLDNVTLKALAKEPERRYRSVLALVEDLERYLADRPVLARPSSLGYRVGKFIRRNTAATLVAATAIIALTVGAVISVSRISAERDLALQAQQQAEATSQFLQSIFYEAEPNNAKGEPLSAIELLSIGKRQIQTQLKDQPEARLQMHRVLSETYYSLGDWDESTDQIEAALALVETLSEPDLAEVASVKLIQAFIAQDRSDFDRAGELLAEVRRLRTSYFDGPHVAVAEAITAEAHLKDMLGAHDAAIEDYREANAMLEQLYPQGHPMSGEVLTKWAGVLRKQDQAESAEPLLLQAIDLLVASHGELHLNVADAKRHLAGIYRDSRRFEQSEALYLEVIADRQKLLGDDALEVGHVYNSYSQMLQDKGDLPTAVAVAENFMRILEIHYQEPSASHGAAYNNFALLQHDAGDYTAALLSFRRSIDVQNAIGLEPDHFHRSFPLYGMANTHASMGDHELAIALYRRALPMRQAAFGEAHLFVSQVKVALAGSLFDTGIVGEARTLVEEALVYLSEHQGQEHPQTVKAVALLEEIRSSLKR